MAKNVLILADIRRQKLRNVTFEMLAAANTVAEGGTVSVAVLGSGVESLVGGLGDAGADTVYLVDAPELANYTPNAYKKAFMEAVRTLLSKIVSLLTMKVMVFMQKTEM